MTTAPLISLYAPAAQLVIGFSFIVMIGALAYRFKVWLKDDEPEPSEFSHGWERRE